MTSYKALVTVIVDASEYDNNDGTIRNERRHVNTHHEIIEATNHDNQQTILTKVGQLLKHKYGYDIQTNNIQNESQYLDTLQEWVYSERIDETGAGIHDTNTQTAIGEIELYDFHIRIQFYKELETSPRTHTTRHQHCTYSAQVSVDVYNAHPETNARQTHEETIELIIPFNNSFDFLNQLHETLTTHTHYHIDKDIFIDTICQYTEHGEPNFVYTHKTNERTYTCECFIEHLLIQRDVTEQPQPNERHYTRVDLQYIVNQEVIKSCSIIERNRTTTAHTPDIAAMLTTYVQPTIDIQKFNEVATNHRHTQAYQYNETNHEGTHEIHIALTHYKNTNYHFNVPVQNEPYPY